MCVELALSYARRVLIVAIVFSGPLLRATDVKLAWDASLSPGITGYTLKYGTSSGSYSNTRSVGNTLTATASNLQAGVRYYFVVTAKDSSGLESDPSNEISYTPGSISPNRPPVINAIADISFNEDAPAQVVTLSGIAPGSNEVQTLTVTATSSNPGLIPNPVVTYSGPGSTGSLTLAPLANANGTATITVTVNDGQSQSNTASRAFTATVNAVNDPPTLNPLNNLSLNLNAAPQTVALSGIGSGAANEAQTLTVTASHNNPSLLGAINVNYASPASTGTLTFTPVSGASGSAVVTVRVQDNGGGTDVISRTFTVNISSSSGHTLFAEAESATLVAPMIRSSDSRALGGQYISSASAEQGTASFSINIPVVGSYRIWCRILSPWSSADSFYVKMDAGTEDIYDTADNLWSGDWQWTLLNGRLSGNPRLFNLSQGNHTLVFRTRENTTALDAVYITDDAAFVPDSSAAPGATNKPPTLNAIANLSIAEDSGSQTINLTGISAGATNENQTLIVTATSSNPGLIPSPTVSYTSPNSTGSLHFTPVANANGTATISVTVNDGQSQNRTLTRTFTVTVQPVNDPPLVNAGSDATVRLPAWLALAGSASDDGAWNATWSTVSGPGPAVFSAATSLTGNASFPVAGQYVLRLTVSDGSISSSDDLTVTVLPALDLTGPVVSGLVIESMDAAGFTARWQTDEPGLCQIEFGRSTSLGSSTKVESAASLNHQASVTNLLSATAYYYRVRSTDVASNVSVTPVMSITTAPLNVIGWAGEAGFLTAPMQLGASETALGKAYVFSSSSNAGTVTFPITLSVPSTYQLWCRLSSPAAGRGSFQVSLDGGSADTFDVAESGWKNGWRWVTANGRAGAGPLTVDPRTFSLAAGSHQFVFRVSEPSVLLDELILSNDPRWTPGIDGAPPTLRASALPPNSVNLSWTDGTANEDGFEIEISTDGRFFAPLAIVWSGTTNYLHRGLAAGATYYYRLYALTDSDRTDYSNAASAQLGTAPLAPSDLVATSTTPGAPVQLNWQDNSGNETGFSIERSNDGTTFAAVQSVGANVTAAADNPGRRDWFYYRVRAYNAFGNSPYSAVGSVRVK